MANEAPERIWATVNGMSTRLPDGSRQLVGGWSQDPSRSGVTEYIRADLAALSSDAVAGGEEADGEKPRYTTKRLRREIERARENDARELDQLRDRVKELEKALDGVLPMAEEKWANPEEIEEIRTARRVREGGKV